MDKALSTNTTAVPLAALIPWSHFETQVTLVTMRERPTQLKKKDRVIITEGADWPQSVLLRAMLTPQAMQQPDGMVSQRTINTLLGISLFKACIPQLLTNSPNSIKCQGMAFKLRHAGN